MSNTFTILWTVPCQTPLSLGFPRQEHYSGLPFPSPGNLPQPGIEPTSPARAGTFFTTESPTSDIKQNEIMPFEVTWMDLETVISEVSQTGEDKYRMISLICGI